MCESINLSNTTASFDTWKKPTINESTFRAGLVVNNSLSGSKVEFIPALPGKHIKWYACGPTVYDVAHMGHARTYISFDVIRRILRDYFGYDVFMCMNITDIDDKIIQRSNEKGVDFSMHARYYESLFWKDMQELNVELPDIITRVSEYIPEVIEFIEGIIQNGYGYVSEGSVYFNTQVFRQSDNHVYGRMEPFSVNDEARVLEGEGHLSVVSEKRCPLDFALWKKSKTGEPFWISPWGNGRPGWHIECSAMASKALGSSIDIHSGGIDLRFPHHDNELAQSEAYFDNSQWVNYFLHSGHLHIKGSKMSKSLKNFITIQECLKHFSPRTLRLLVLIHKWDAPMNYSSDGESLDIVTEIDKIFANVFSVASFYLRSTTASSESVQEPSRNSTKEELKELKGLMGNQKWNQTDLDFHQQIINTHQLVDEALKDNFKTPAVLNFLRQLVTQIHCYINNANEGVKGSLVIKASRFIFRVLKILGVTNGNEMTLDYLNLNIPDSANNEATLVDVLSKYRQQVRVNSQNFLKSIKNSPDPSFLPQEMISFAQNLLKISDEIRDGPLVDMGFKLEDGSQECLWKRIDIKGESQEVTKATMKGQLKKEQKEATQKQHEINRSRKENEIKIPPRDYFITLNPNIYGEVDKDGVPVSYANGEALSLTYRRKLAKLLEKHTKKHQDWLASIDQGNSSVIE
ncbi:cysteine--tRNA ligase, cytoplasmic-like [Hylaeus volcanicus]|uniref:cysteine--tRNA ligase, cytoplasmic-like n=1 Tax=Hylaeus volcanicus TaxID=313075 RepID=UPI0023B8630C|nr:cysteine--tRNA ligase, cytoplasmic-like [Hylaeus volcanicus]